MDYDRLCSWLGLSAGSWPPDHYVLLGLVRGSGDMADIEARVLERMEQLRQHQLLHPELVTDGMNRLAQALVCLTDPVARAEYDHSLGIPALAVEAVEAVENESKAQPDDTKQSEPLADVPYDLGKTDPEKSVASPPSRLPYEVVEPEEREPDPLPYKVAAYEVVDPEPLPLPPAYEVVEPEELPLAEPVAEQPAIPETHQPPLPAPINRRAVYRQLALLRKSLRAWEMLRPVFGTPTEALVTPAAVLLFVQALATVRESLPGVSRVIGAPGSPGGMVAALVRLPHALHAVRVLIPAQRETVALDWRHGYEALLRERIRLRAMARAARPRRRVAAGVRLLHTLRRTPEWFLLLALAAAVVLALVRRGPQSLFP